jgi:hypothetical protein
MDNIFKNLRLIDLALDTTKHVGVGRKLEIAENVFNG